MPRGRGNARRGLAQSAFQMHRLFLPLDEEVSCRLMDNGKMMLDVAHLIDRKCVERYQNKFATTSAMMRECQMQLSGPWPPYHFVHRLTSRNRACGRSHAATAPVVAPAARCCSLLWRWLRRSDQPFQEKLRLRLELFV